MKRRIQKILFILFPVFFVGIFIFFFFLPRMMNSKTITPIKISAKNRTLKYQNMNYEKDVNLHSSIITEGGKYHLSGDYECLRIDTLSNVLLVLDHANISCQDGPGIYVEEANVVNIQSIGENSIVSETSPSFDGAIYSKDNLIFSGNGTLNITSNYSGIVSKDMILIQSGNYEIHSLDDGIKGRDYVFILDGVFSIQSNKDGIKTTNSIKGDMIIDQGEFLVQSMGDAFQTVHDLIIHNGNFQIVTKGDANKNSSKALKSGNLLQIDDGKFRIDASDDGIHSDNNLLIQNGTFELESLDDGIHANGLLLIQDGSFQISSKEGLESTSMILNGGDFIIHSDIHGLTVGRKKPNSSVYMEINDGNYLITVGDGDTSAIDSNGDVSIFGGNIEIKAKTPFDYSGKATYQSGKIIINGKERNSIPKVESKERVPMENFNSGLDGAPPMEPN